MQNGIVVNQTKLNLALVSFICAFGVSLGVVVLLALAGVVHDVLAPIFVIGTVVLSYFFFHDGDIRNILAYTLVALGLLLLLFPTFMYLGIPKSFPELDIRITDGQALMVGASTGLAALILAFAILKSPFKGK